MEEYGLKELSRTGPSVSPMIFSGSSRFLRWERMKSGPGPSGRAPRPWMRPGSFTPTWPGFIRAEVISFSGTDRTGRTESGQEQGQVAAGRQGLCG